MKLKIIILVTAIMLSGVSYSQVTKDSYEKAVKILNYQSVYYSLSVISSTKGVTAEFIENCNCEENPTFEKINASIPKTELKTIEISEEIQKLKTKKITELTKEKAEKELTIEVFETSNLLNEFKKELIQKEKFDDLTKVLNEKIKIYDDENFDQKQPIPPNLDSEIESLDKRVSSIERRNSGKTEKEGYLGALSDYLILIAIVIGILGLFLPFKKQESYETILQKILESKRLKNLITLHANLNKSNTDNISNSSELIDIHNRLRDLETLISKINNQLHKQSVLFQNEPTQNKYREIILSEPKTETLYLSTPNSDGSFNESSASTNYKDGASIYKLTKIGNGNANFQIDEKQTSIKLALQYPDKNIDPVCDAENAFNPRTTRIFTIKKGQSELQDGKWIIKSKTIIRYEN